MTERLHNEGLILTGLCRYPLTTRDMDDVARAVFKVLKNGEKLLSDGR